MKQNPLYKMLSIRFIKEKHCISINGFDDINLCVSYNADLHDSNGGKLGGKTKESIHI